MVASFFVRLKLRPAVPFEEVMSRSLSWIIGNQFIVNSRSRKLVRSMIDQELDLGSFDAKNCSNIGSDRGKLV